MDERPPSNLVGEMFQFNRLIGKSIIRVVYFVGLGAIGLFALISLLASLSASAMGLGGGGLIGVIMALVIFAFGSLTWRLTCELWYVLFKIYDELREANGKSDAT